MRVIFPTAFALYLLVLGLVLGVIAEPATGPRSSDPAPQAVDARATTLVSDDIYAQAMALLQEYDRLHPAQTKPGAADGDGIASLAYLPKPLRQAYRSTLLPAARTINYLWAHTWETLWPQGRTGQTQRPFVPASSSRHDPDLDAYVLPYPLDHPDTPEDAATIDPRVGEAMRLLHYLADRHQHASGLLSLAHIYLYSKYRVPRRLDRSFRAYYIVAQRHGDPTAQYMVGWYYATGFGFDTPLWRLPEHDVPALADTPTDATSLMAHFPYSSTHPPQRSPSKATLYYTFAALQGHLPAKLTVAYRYHSGTGSPANCDVALSNYMYAARRAIHYYQSGPPGGRMLPFEMSHLYEADEGAYGVRLQDSHKLRDPTMLADVLEYYRYVADRGDIKARYILAQTYYLGTRDMAPNFSLVIKYLRSLLNDFFVATQKTYTGPKYQEPSGPNGIDQAWLEAFFQSVDEHTLASNDAYVGHAASLLGQMYARGEGVRPNNATAYYWFQRGAERASPNAMYWLGLFYRDGSVVPKDRELAAQWFAQAAKRRDVDGWVQLGLWYKDLKLYDMAFKHFSVAARAGHLLAMYHLAQLYHRGRGVQQSCLMAVNLLKKVVEQADWLYSPVDLSRFNSRQAEADSETQLINYSLAAEMGYEAAQTNLAWLLEQAMEADTQRWMLHRIAPQLALSAWTRAANQGNLEARVKAGDYYFYGRGTPRDLKKAATCYQVAAENHMNPIAMWNLGWMYENGLGVDQDFHLAKRWYDRAAATFPRGSLPVTLSLIKLAVRYLWARLRGDDMGPGSLFFGSSSAQVEPAGEVPMHPPTVDSEAPQDGLTFGEANEDPVEVHWHNPFGHARGRQDYYPGPGEGDDAGPGLLDPNGLQDDLDYQTAGPDYNEHPLDLDEDTWLENIIILFLCVVVGWMMYVRQNRFGGNDENNNNNNGDAPGNPAPRHRHGPRGRNYPRSPRATSTRTTPTISRQTSAADLAVRRTASTMSAGGSMRSRPDALGRSSSYEPGRAWGAANMGAYRRPLTSHSHDPTRELPTSGPPSPVRADPLSTTVESASSDDTA
ncbi:ERAD-associated protein [Dimargaris verticillata]|uniref:ERAD-associated protein n=1 Tax=Dimargaris verticillata TaxID=2761393 RepID=A0A9W8BAP9_9FUNG|nr:ERAD-associated protein [Dimargaris verticillata]